MTWYVDFRSLVGTEYRVLIGDDGGGATPLAAAAEPFVTEEDAGGDLFTPVRIQTGYVRVLTDDVSLMGSIIPIDNTSAKVYLKSRESNATVWEGFLLADGYSQPWEGGLNMIELPVKSVLGSLYDVTISESYKGQLMSFSEIISNALTSVGYPLHSVSLKDDCNGSWLFAKINASVFFTTETISNQGERETVYFGKSYGEIIEGICRLFGLMCRDTGTNLLFSTYDKPTGFAIGVLTTVFSFRGTGHQQSFIQGRNQAVVRLSLDDISDNLASLPYTSEGTSEVYTIEKVANGTAKVQPHYRSNSAVEIFTYSYYSGQSALPSGSSYNDCLHRSVVFTPLVPPVTDDPSFITGAFPVRYSFNPTDDNTFKLLANGLMVNIRRMLDYDDVMPSNLAPVYTMVTDRSYSFADGYLNIEMAISCFAETSAGYDRRKTQFGIQNYYYTRNYKMFMQLKWGSKYWNGTEWASNKSAFEVVTDGAKILTNLGENTMVTKSDGLFFPVTSLMEGEIELSIMNFAAFKVTYPNEESEVLTVNSSIISKLNIIYLAKVKDTSSDRNENVYRQTILSSGFSEDEEVSLNIGTMNNNFPSYRFIKSDATTYIETLSYEGVSQRPEMHLLQRMVSYYGRVRRKMRAIVATGLDLYNELYSHNGHVFVGIDASHNWRDNEQEIEFIEVR